MAIIYALIGAALGAMLYWCGRKVRTYAAWAQGTQPPQEKLVVFMPATAISFGVAVYLIYAPIEKILACRAIGESALQCLL